MKSKNTVKEIASRQNARFKTWASLLESKGIKSSGLCLLSGTKVIAEILRDQSHLAVEWLLPPKFRPPETDLPCYQLTGELFREVDVVGTKGPLLVCNTPEIPTWKVASPIGLEVIVALSDPNNLGALLRSAEAFSVRRVILTKECASPFLPKALRASAGSAFRVPLAMGPALADIHVETAVGLDLNGEDLGKYKFQKNSFLILGEEGQGLPEQLNLTRIRIPMAAGIESLNATVAASLALFRYSQQE